MLGNLSPLLVGMKPQLEEDGLLTLLVDRRGEAGLIPALSRLAYGLLLAG